MAPPIGFKKKGNEWLLFAPGQPGGPWIDPDPDGPQGSTTMEAEITFEIHSGSTWVKIGNKWYRIP